MQKTRLSSKGQIVIPLGIREHHQWHPGTEFSILDTAQGLLLVPFNPYQSTTPNDILGCIHYSGPPKTLKEMEQGILKGVTAHGNQS